MCIFADRGGVTSFAFGTSYLLFTFGIGTTTALAQAPRPGGGTGNQEAAAEIETSEDGQIIFTPIELKTRNGSGYAFGRHIHRLWLACGNGRDVMFDGVGLYAMHEPGVVEVIRGVGGGSWGETDDLQWDGRYVWVSSRSEKGRGVVLDGNALTPVAVFTEADGMRGTEYGCVIAPLGEGVATVVGSGKDKCAWIANLIVGRDGDGERKQVEVFHEACRSAAEDDKNRSKYQDVHMAFAPRFALPVFRGDQMWVVVGRHCGRGGMTRAPVSNNEAPLIVDPYQREVTLVRKRWPFGTVAAGGEDRLYLSTKRDHPLIPMFGEALPPEFLVSEVSFLADPGRGLIFGKSAIVHEGMFHGVGPEWTTVDISTGRRVRRSLLGKNQQFGKVAVSNHYGLVFMGSSGLWQVSFP